MNQKPFFTGVCTALVTPFLQNEVNYPMLERLLQFQMDAGIRNIVICGTTGESPTLSDTEKLELFRRSKAFVGENCRIIAGTGSNCTEHAVALSRAAEQTGVDGLLLVSPYYNKTTPRGYMPTSVPSQRRYIFPAFSTMSRPAPVWISPWRYTEA